MREDTYTNTEADAGAYERLRADADYDDEVTEAEAWADELMDEVAGHKKRACPSCASNNTNPPDFGGVRSCNNCGYNFR